MPAFNKD